jgi:predicted DNA-binding transcriptional regulator AlpA
MISFISIHQIAELFNVSPKQARRITQKPGFPARHDISERSPRWKLNEVIKWADAQKRFPQLLPDTIPDHLRRANPTGPRPRRAR